ncbi:6-pyruvoyltetrahydropterin/6-carboxytetrahydropterin synthase [Halalkaliarchaeum desulfuricum]|uniref:6-pyruvoyltetrahydropterin/6-carboxytetrahydropterin synthase n=1 Tax=Halalkaliarchaeum desulfuricum TaxID=2055893 RepID=A0A343THJ5_9EURY|nr:6-carboxytetrahydropterin synthase [Halalkaliarchaeum desulfuricum]AUX08567.1 6-pyruvoyltetrahydropterin/6-carboxytetrahydropterin synthase [Halalkaliarchaeum desulfuricum]
MYSVTVTETFIAQHYLTVPNPGPEGELHSHQFTMEATFEGEQLGEYGYLIDIDDVKAGLDAVRERYADETLNEQPAFEGRNPSVEHFSRIACETLLEHVDPAAADRVRVRMWEDDDAAAGYETAL